MSGDDTDQGRVRQRVRGAPQRTVVPLADCPAGTEGPAFTVRLRSDHPELLDGLRAGRTVLAVDSWKVWQRAQGPDEVQLWVDAHWRLASWGTGPSTG
ncbi:hypothetical protein ABZ752_32875 [Streptomyces roseifaciens]